LDGQGERSKCSRVHKDGISYLPAEREGFERYLALYQTPRMRAVARDADSS